MVPRVAPALLLALALAACGEGGGATTDAASTSATTDATTGAPTSSGTTAAGGSTTDASTGTTGPTTDATGEPATTDVATTDATTGGGVDCEALPALGPPALLWTGYDGSEDLAFDGAGHLALKRGGQIVLVAADQSETILADGFPQVYGTRFAAGGDLLVALPQAGALQAVSPGGAVSDVAAGLAGPNGVYVDPAGRVWLTEFGGSRIVRFEADWTKTTIYSGPMAASANGLVLDPDRGALFFTNYGAGRLLRLAVDAQGLPVGEPALVTTLDGAKVDGLALDVCGHVYAVDQGGSALYRIRLDVAGEHLATDPAVQFPSNVANPQFGRGPGFDPENLYLAGNPGDVYVVDVGVPGAPIGLP